MKRITALIICALILTLSLCSCGKSTSYDKSFAMDSVAANSSMGWADDYDYDYGYVEEEVCEDVAYEAPAMAPIAPDVGSVEADELKASERKLIKNKELSVETLEFDDFTSQIEGMVSSYGGYIQNSTQNGNSYYNKRNLRSASYTIRVPAQRFDEFTKAIGDMATVTYTYEYIDDITAKYVDTEARLASLRAEQESFMKLMERAETVEEILKIQSYLTDVNYQIESYTAQLNTFKSLVSYSTVNLNVTEVERLTTTPAAKPSAFERIKTNISDNLYDIGEGFTDMFVGIVSAAPYLAILAVIVIIAVVIVKIFVKKYRKAELKAQAAAQKSDESK